MRPTALPWILALSALLASPDLLAQDGPTTPLDQPGPQRRAMRALGAKLKRHAVTAKQAKHLKDCYLGQPYSPDHGPGQGQGYIAHVRLWQIEVEPSSTSPGAFVCKHRQDCIRLTPVQGAPALPSMPRLELTLSTQGDRAAVKAQRRRAQDLWRDLALACRPGVL